MLVTFGNQEILPPSFNFLSRAIAQILHILLPKMSQFLKRGGGGKATSISLCMLLRVPLEQEISLVVSRSRMGA